MLGRIDGVDVTLCATIGASTDDDVDDERNEAEDANGNQQER
jgi:hypothetical protein